MKVKELIAKLSECDPEKEVYLYNGEGWLTKHEVFDITDSENGVEIDHQIY